MAVGIIAGCLMVIPARIGVRTVEPVADIGGKQDARDIGPKALFEFPRCNCRSLVTRRREGVGRHQRTERLAGDIRGEGIEAMSEFLECLADLMEKYRVDKVDVELIAQQGRKE